MTDNPERLFPAVNLLVEAAAAHPDNVRGQARFLRQRLRTIEDFDLLEDVMFLLLPTRLEHLKRPPVENWNPAIAKSEGLNRQARALAPKDGKEA
jgi:hypothetical protein